MGRKIRLYVSIGTFLILIMMTFLAALPVSASPLTSVTLDLQDEAPSVDVSPGSSGIVEVNGVVTCVKYGPDQVKVSLAGSSDMGGTSVDPPNMVFSGVSGVEETRTFMATTRVPQGTTSTATPELMVSGIFVQGGLQYPVNPVSIIIEVVPYCKIAVEPVEREIKVNAGEDLHIEAVITNVGNCEDIYSIDMMNRASLANNGFGMPSPMEITFLEKENRTIDWKMETKSHMSGKYYMRMSVYSKTIEEGVESVSAFAAYEVEIIAQPLTNFVFSFLLSPFMIVIIVVIVIVGMVYRNKKKS